MEKRREEYTQRGAFFPFMAGRNTIAPAGEDLVRGETAWSRGFFTGETGQ
jgi:hypothetical protein